MQQQGLVRGEGTIMLWLGHSMAAKNDWIREKPRE